MYLPTQFEEARLEVLHELMRSHPFGTLVIATPSGLLANHFPFTIASDEGELGTLRAHMARANPAWRHLQVTKEALAIFQGPQSYITPCWYPSKQADGKVARPHDRLKEGSPRKRPVRTAAWQDSLSPPPARPPAAAR